MDSSSIPKIAKIPFYYFLIIFAFALLFKAWLLSPNQFFIYDDFSHLLTVQQNSVATLFHIWPQQMYNDRPFGLIIIKLLYSLFSDNYQPYSIVIFLIHLLNSFLFLSLSTKILNKFNIKNSYVLALVSTLLFSVWPRSTFVVQWVSAIFDLVSTFLSLIFLSILLKNKINTILQGILLFITYYLAIRTKESIIFLPLISLLLVNPKNKKYIYPSVILMIFYLISLIFLGMSSNFQHFQNANPYYPSLNPINWIKSTFNYFYLYTNIRESGIDFTSYSIIGLTSLSIFIVSAIYTLKNNYKKYLYLLFAAILALGPVILLTNRQQKLYLYFPSIFLSILTTLIVYNLFDKIHIKKYFIPAFALIIIFANYIDPLYQT